MGSVFPHFLLSLFPSLAFPLQLRCQNVAACWSVQVGGKHRGVLLCVWRSHTLTLICARRMNDSREWGWRPLVSPTNCSTTLGESSGSPTESCRNSRWSRHLNVFQSVWCNLLSGSIWVKPSANWTNLLENYISWWKQKLNIQGDGSCVHEISVSFSLAAISSTFGLQHVGLYWESSLGQASRVSFSKQSIVHVCLRGKCRLSPLLISVIPGVSLRRSVCSVLISCFV